MSRLRQAALTLVLALAMGGLTAAAAQDYPTRPVTLVVPQAPGGTNDLVARFLAERLSQTLGQRFLVENRAGAGGNVGTASAAKAQPDGYTLLVTVNSSQAINPALYKSVQFDPVRDFEPITLLATVPYIFVAHPSFPANSLQELIDLAKNKPGEFQFGSAGNGTINHLLGEMLNEQAGIKLGHVPYRGVAALVNDMIAGHVKLGFGTPPSVLPHIEAKTLKAFGVSSFQRLAAAPDIPTLAETVPGYGAELWVALFAVKGTPAPIVSKLQAESVKAMNDPQSKAKLAAQGAEVSTSTPQELAKMLDEELVKWREIVAKTGARLD